MTIIRRIFAPLLKKCISDTEKMFSICSKYYLFTSNNLNVIIKLPLRVEFCGVKMMEGERNVANKKNAADRRTKDDMEKEVGARLCAPC